MSHQEFTSTWVYFFALAYGAKSPGHPAFPHSKRDAYRVDAIRPVRGEGSRVEPGALLVRVETASRFALADEALPPVAFQGVTAHLSYTNAWQREELTRISRSEVKASPDTVAVLIPIRKSAAWWGQAQDERQAHFQKMEGPEGHTAIGASYAHHIYRKLYHAKYTTETTYDFLTYFEFERARTAEFESLLAGLRDTKRNPEWSFVESECEIWMTKIAGPEV